MRKFIWLVVLIVVVLIVVALVLGGDSPEPTESILADQNAVLVEDQKPADQTVVTFAKLSKPGFVALLGASSGTSTPALMGASDWLAAGEYRHLTIEHNDGQVLPHGSAVAIVTLADDGNKKFELGVDKEILFQPNTRATGTRGFALIKDEAESVDEPSEEELASMLVEAGYELLPEPSAESAE